MDTNIVSDLVRHPQGRIFDHIRKVGDANVATSIIVASELRFGAVKKNAPKLSAQLERVLSVLPVLPFEHPADEHYGILRADLERRGRPIGGNDMLIAAQAIALDAVLVTANRSEFARVADLQVENWLG
ncbi:type II toxin-antitoxin system VapC family toxin [Sphingosinicella rhizophila]|uniref:Type II toxin-antitoxin system VapC family toxin n=1 Tax=Sphingosinicella rhizophila TaxID=3050082 RepID=A0ABU3Q7M3_9SPHN|nr:type II toxin-antitoxin system VapC family toxin [Sphingosinicella sp. GR2756]MDT9598945.1 type II toxin-antitoxin system VapC family toxin [Sphingosinicella sp. GR2756]